jgi:prepilin-type N-terminal cleavage/methylation domain-containing protein
MARRGFTYVELLVAMGIIAVLLVLLLPVIGRVKASARGVRCASNLHQIALGFQHYAMSNGGRLPEPLAIDLAWERVLLPYVGSDEIYKCPADDELFTSLGSSYDWRDTGDAGTTLAGALMTEAKPDTTLVFDALPNWHAPGKMYAARLDGSAALMNTRECLADVMTPLRGKPSP